MRHGSGMTDFLFSCLMQADFMKMPFPDSTFDAVYAIEATCHAPDAVCQFKILPSQKRSFSSWTE